MESVELLEGQNYDGIKKVIDEEYEGVVVVILVMIM